MDTLLIPACLILFITTVSALVQVAIWRKKAKDSEHAAMDMAMQLSRVARDSHDAAWEECKRHMLRLLYRIAIRAEREGRDAFAALRDVSQQVETESVVQVPAEA